MIVSTKPKIKTFISILAVEATAGFIISTNGLIRNIAISESDIAIPLKKPATPIPNVNHIFSHRDDTKSINAKTGKVETKQYPVYLTSVSNSKVPLGKKIFPIIHNTKQKQILAWVLLSCGVIIAGVILGGITGKLVLDHII